MLCVLIRMIELSEALLMSINNKSVHEELRKILCEYLLLSGAVFERVGGEKDQNSYH